MSDYEQHMGKVKLIRENADEDYFRQLAAENKQEWASYNDSWESVIRNSLYTKYVIVGDKVYEVIEKEELDGCDDIIHARKIGDGEYFFVLKFYNGGTCFSECIEEALTEAE